MATKPKPKSAAQLATERKMRSQATASKAKEVQQLRDYYKKNGHVPTLLSNVSNARFGETDSKRVSELGALVATGKMTRAEAEKRVRQGAGVANEDSRRAGLDVAADLDPKISAAARRRAAAKQGYTEDTAAAASQTESSIAADSAGTEANRSKVAAIYEQLMKTMQGTAPAINSLYEGQAAANTTATASLQEQIKAAYDRANTGTQAQVAGLRGDQTRGQAQGLQDSGFLSSIAGIQAQSQAGVLQAGQQGANAIQQASVYGSGAEGAGRQADMLAQLLQRSGKSRADLTEFNREAGQDWREEDKEYGGQIADLEESRYSKLYEGKQALAAARAQAAQEADDREFERGLAESKLDIDRAEVSIKQQTIQQRADEAAAKLGLDRDKLNLLTRQTDAKLAAEQRKYTPGTPEYDEIQVAIDLKRAQAAATVTNARTNQQQAADSAANNNVKNQIAQQNADTRARPKAGSGFGKGVGGAQQYMKQGVRPDFQPNLNRLLGYLNREYAGDAATGTKNAERVIRERRYPPDVAAAARRMVGIYYGTGS